MKYSLFSLFLFLIQGISLCAQETDSAYLLQPDRVFDGRNMHEHWDVWVKGHQIMDAGESGTLHPTGPFTTLVLKGATLLPGLIEGHSHLFLHPYNETKWDQQVLNESIAERTARAVVHARNTLMAGFTTVRDLGTEGAGYSDVGLKEAIGKGIIPGPRMIVATRAIVATGSYGPKRKNLEHQLVRGAAEADGYDALIKEARTQIGNGADLVKVYADYRWGLETDISEPTFTLEELKTVVAVASSSGREVVAHASTAEGMRRAALAGVATIEHGDNGTKEIFDLMKEHNVAYCPTLSAAEATASYDGWKPGTLPEPVRVSTKRKSFALALQEGVTICMGGDVGVFTHGDNAREMEAMVRYGMKPLEVLRSATSVNAKVFGYGDKIGSIRKGMLADLIAVSGNPADTISAIRNIRLVMKEGHIYSAPLTHSSKNHP
ncbi:MAG: amidohydrolase family protein [Bacteroidota bacterium]|nr:amidohydrolase family protein [Bacteroidota bacterium]